jgi:UDPglucose--hexose-1-phosphate uridylyltransferase
MAFKSNQGDEMFQSFKAHGWSEIVVETRNHTKELHELSVDEIKAVLQVYADRTSELNKKEGVEQVCIIKDNQRSEFDHSYSKVFTLPIVPKKMKEKMEKLNDYRYKHDSCLYCDIIKKEKNSPRVIFENDHFICFVPFAPEHEYELMIIPKKHYSEMHDMNDFEMFTLAETIKSSILRLSAAIKPLRYCMAFYLKPKNEKDFHFHITIVPKQQRSSIGESYWLDLHKNTPEDIAKILKGKS